MPSVAFEPQVVPEPPVWPQSVVTVVGNPRAGSRTHTRTATWAGSPSCWRPTWSA